MEKENERCDEPQAVRRFDRDEVASSTLHTGLLWVWDFQWGGCHCYSMYAGYGRALTIVTTHQPIIDAFVRVCVWVFWKARGAAIWRGYSDTTTRYYYYIGQGEKLREWNENDTNFF